MQELCEYLRGDKTTAATVSAVLAAHPDLFVSDNADPPRWSTVRWQTKRTAEPARRQTASPALYRWQQEALTAWRARGRRGLIEAVTGTGKTRLGLEAAREELAAGGKVLVVVPSRELLNQWHTTLRSTLRGYRIDRLGDGHHGTLRESDLLVATVHTAKNYKLLRAGQPGLLVADECHRYGADTFQLVLDQTFPHRLGLTATYERSDGGHLAYIAPYFGGPPVFSLGYQRAIADDVAAHFKLALIGVQFTSAEQQQYSEADEALRNARSLLIRYGAPQEPYGEFMRVVSEFAEGPASPQRIAALRYLAAFGHRRQVLADSSQKLTLLTQLGKAINAATGSLIFTMTTQSADSIAAALRQHGVPTQAMHSGLRSTQRKDLLQRFARHDLKALVAPMVLDEGVDVPEADLAIIVAASRTRRQMIQRMGRVLRKKADHRLARIAIMYVAGSFEDPERGAHEAFLDTVRDVSDDYRNFRPSTALQQTIDYLSDRRPVLTTGHRIVVDRVLGWNASCSCGWTHPQCFRKKRDALRSAEPHLTQASPGTPHQPPK